MFSWTILSINFLVDSFAQMYVKVGGPQK